MAREQAWEQRLMTNQVGTLYYRAPELLAGDKAYNNKVDVWALGCIFYFMQTGNLLFKGTSEVDQFKTIITSLGADISQVKNPKIREALKSVKMESVPENWSHLDKFLNEIDYQFLKKMVALDPDSRLSCKELLKDPYFRDQ
jgi:serine/threonine protein kinase